MATSAVNKNEGVITAEPIRSFGWFISFVGPDFKYSSEIGQETQVEVDKNNQPKNDALPAISVEYTISPTAEPYRMPWGDTNAYIPPIMEKKLSCSFYDIANFNGLYYTLLNYLNGRKKVKTIKVKKLLANNSYYEGIVFHNCFISELKHDNMNHEVNDALKISAVFNWEYALVYDQSEGEQFRNDN